jgi:large subunit ribosomal protein L16
MLVPKRVKFRRPHRGVMKGKATRGNTIAYGEYGLQALEAAWITNRQIEAARIAISSGAVKSGLRFSPTSPLLPSPPKLGWVVVRVLQNTG